MKSMTNVEIMRIRKITKYVVQIWKAPEVPIFHQIHIQQGLNSLNFPLSEIWNA